MIQEYTAIMRRVILATKTNHVYKSSPSCRSSLPVKTPKTQISCHRHISRSKCLDRNQKEKRKEEKRREKRSWKKKNRKKKEKGTKTKREQVRRLQPGPSHLKLVKVPHQACHLRSFCCLGEETEILKVRCSLGHPATTASLAVVLMRRCLLLGLLRCRKTLHLLKCLMRLLWCRRRHCPEIVST